MTSSTAILEDATERAGLFGLLARLWMNEPGAELIDALWEDSIKSALPDWFAIPTADELDDLQADFTQLFIGPKEQLPPYQSVWHHGQFEAAPTGAMRTYFDVSGYEPDAVSVDGTMPDHIAVQFDMMRHLLQEVAGQSTTEPAMCDLLASYFDDALSWCMPLLEAVANRATTKFYASIARLTGEFLADEAARFGHTG